MLNPFETENIELRLSFLEGKEIKKVKEEKLLETLRQELLNWKK